MDKTIFEDKLIEYLSGTISEEDKILLEEAMTNDDELQTAFEQLQSTWKELDHLQAPAPSELMDDKFYAALSSEIEHELKKELYSSNNFLRNLKDLFTPRPLFVSAMGAVLLLLGMALGYWVAENSTNDHTMIVSSEETAIRETLVLTLLEQPSVNKRLQGINEANKFDKAEGNVIQALLYTLNNDPNVNVRLAAIASLAKYGEDANVREGLVKSIVIQDSPIIQTTLADLMVALQEKRSVKYLEELVRTKQLDASAKKKIEESIRSLI